MLIRDTTWSKIREKFTEDEKANLRECVTGDQGQQGFFNLELP